MDPSPPIARHKTALVRTELSRPIRQALADGLLQTGQSVFDYGCGQGGDVRRLREAGFECFGWDPVHRPSEQRRSSDLVNLGYVVNVIEDGEERRAALHSSWQLTQRVLIVAARLREDAKGTSCAAFEDGGLTKAGTFQKFYLQSELREWINQTLSVESVAAAPGIFYVFRSDAEREVFLAKRFRRQTAAPRLRQSDVLFEQHRELLEPLMSFYADRGRLPADDELEEATRIREALGSIRQAYRVVQRVTGEDQWKQVSLGRTEDLLLYVALARFDRRPRMSDLPRAIQLDIKAFFATYTNACKQADELLFALGNQDLLQAAIGSASVGKRTLNGLYVHRSALDQLPTILRAFEGCANAYIGTVEGANLVKLHRGKPQVSYLSYPDFETNPHPALMQSVLVDLQTFRVDVRDYSQSPNPPVLHRKELFVAADYHLRPKFSGLTQQEERVGLLDRPETIGTRDGWAERLRELHFRTIGHRLVRSKPAPS